MTKKGQELTYKTYADPQIVAGYTEANSKNPKLFEAVERFSLTLPGKRVIDIGCGPGHDAYHFAELGFDVTGLDYSQEMIRAAFLLQQVENPPRFMAADMREVGGLFPKDAFDGAWVSASVLHIPQEDAPMVLDGIHKIVVNNGKVYIGLKGGIQGAQIVGENKYSKLMEREFTFWERDNFRFLAEKLGYTVEFITETEGGFTGNSPTSWLNFYLKVTK